MEEAIWLHPPQAAFGRDTPELQHCANDAPRAIEDVLPTRRRA
jgi:hypothetical protein